MQQEWQEFLREQSTASAGAPPAHAGLLADLSPMSIVRVAGTDATSFLQAQLSNDLLRLGNTQSQLSAWCDAKGRVLAILRIFKHNDEYFLLFPAELGDRVCKRLKMFVLRSKVEITGISNTLPRFALFGAGAEGLLQTWHSAPGVDEVIKVENTHCLRLPGESPSFMFIGETDACTQLWCRLQGEAVATAAEYWYLDRILAGQPQVFAQTQGEFVPQMLNLHWVGGIDFQKGCYPGQEVVARLQYRGKLKRRMFLARFDSSQTPAPGTTVSTADDNNAGQVVMAAQSDEAQQHLLAVLKTDAAGHAMINGQPLELLELPYATPD